MAEIDTRTGKLVLGDVCRPSESRMEAEFDLLGAVIDGRAPPGVEPVVMAIGGRHAVKPT